MKGSPRIVEALFDFYHSEVNRGGDIDRTVRCPNLPVHIHAGVHEVASTFKSFLEHLPGGILGSVSLLDAFIAIESQLDAEPEVHRSRLSKVRARLIALAIGTLKPQYRRDLLCAVLGLLSLIGRTAENTAREDDHGHPLRTSDLMGYDRLGDEFGPVLMNNLMESWDIKLRDHNENIFLEQTKPGSKKTTCPSWTTNYVQEDGVQVLVVDKRKVASNIVMMLITHWREVVRHIRNTGAWRTRNRCVTTNQLEKKQWLRPSASDNVMIQKPVDWSSVGPSRNITSKHGSPASRTATHPERKSSFHQGTLFRSQRNDIDNHRPQDHGGEGNDSSSSRVSKQRPMSTRSMSGKRISAQASAPLLSPTAEKGSLEEVFGSPVQRSLRCAVDFEPATLAAAAATMQESRMDAVPGTSPQQGDVSPALGSHGGLLNPTLEVEQVLPTPESALSPGDVDLLRPALGKAISTDLQDPTSGFEDSTESNRTPTKSKGKATECNPHVLRSSHRSRTSEHSSPRGDMAEGEEKYAGESKPTMQVQPKGSVSRKIPCPTGPAGADTSFNAQVQAARSTATKKDQRIQRGPDYPTPITPESSNQAGDLVDPSILSSSEARWQDQKASPSKARGTSPGTSSMLDVPRWGARQGNLSRASRESSDRATMTWRTPVKAPATAAVDRPLPDPDAGFPADSSTKPQAMLELQARKPPSTERVADEKSQGGAVVSSLQTRNTGTKAAGGVIAMAALFDNASRDEAVVPSPMQKRNSRAEVRKTNVLSKYTTNETPPKSGGSRKSGSMESPQTPLQVGKLLTADSSVRKELTPKRKSLRTSGTDPNPSISPARGIKRSQTPYATGRNLLSPRDRSAYQTRSERDQTSEERDRDHKQLPTLGWMTPHLGEPPIGHRMNFNRGPASPWQTFRQKSSTGQLYDAAAESRETTASPGGWATGGNSLLHAQIRTLQRQLHLKAEECAQLRRQLETREDLDV